jgi:hypothetical protein
MPNNNPTGNMGASNINNANMNVGNMGARSGVYQQPQNVQVQQQVTQSVPTNPVLSRTGSNNR